MSCRRGTRGVIERTGERLVRWRVAYYGDGMVTETLHLTRLGARVSRWCWS